MKVKVKNLAKIIGCLWLAQIYVEASTIEQEYQISVQKGKIAQIYDLMAKYDGTGNQKLFTLARSAGAEMEKYAVKGSSSALCDLAHFYGPQTSNDKYHENWNLSLKWLIEGEKKGLNCDVEKIYNPESLEELDEKSWEKLTSLHYMVAVVEDMATPSDIKQNIPYYYEAKKHLSIKSSSPKTYTSQKIPSYAQTGEHTPKMSQDSSTNATQTIQKSSTAKEPVKAHSGICNFKKAKLSDEEYLILKKMYKDYADADKRLNQVFSGKMKTLNETEKKHLKQSQIEWILERDKILFKEAPKCSQKYVDKLIEMTDARREDIDLKR